MQKRVIILIDIIIIIIMVVFLLGDEMKKNCTSQVEFPRIALYIEYAVQGNLQW